MIDINKNQKLYKVSVLAYISVKFGIIGIPAICKTFTDRYKLFIVREKENLFLQFAGVAHLLYAMIKYPKYRYQKQGRKQNWQPMQS